VEHAAEPERIHIVDSLAGEDDPIEAIGGVALRLRPAGLGSDSVSALVEATGRSPDPGSSTAWTPIMAALTRIARETNAGVLLLHHARKSDDQYRDSSAIGAGADVLLGLSEGQDADVRKVKVKARFPVGDYAVRLHPAAYSAETEDLILGAEYQLAGGDLSLETRVLLHIQD